MTVLIDLMLCISMTLWLFDEDIVSMISRSFNSDEEYMQNKKDKIFLLTLT